MKLWVLGILIGLACAVHSTEQTLGQIVAVTSDSKLAAETTKIQNPQELAAFAQKHRAKILTDENLMVLVCPDAVDFRAIRARMASLDALTTIGGSPVTLQELEQSGIDPALLDFVRYITPDMDGQRENPNFKVMLVADVNSFVSDGNATLWWDQRLLRPAVGQPPNVDPCTYDAAQRTQIREGTCRND